MIANLRIEHFDGLNRTPALRLAARAWNDLLQAGLCQEVILVGWDHQAVVAFHGDRPIGLITWTHAAWLKQLDVIIGWVEPQYRRNGVHTAMWSTLLEKAAELKVLEIHSSTHVLNNRMRATAATQGRREVGVLLAYDLRGEE